jgi:hypothetical protein
LDSAENHPLLYGQNGTKLSPHRGKVAIHVSMLKPSTGLAQSETGPTISTSYPAMTRIENPRVGGSIPPPGTIINLKQ